MTAVIAHRGASAAAPENTVGAFRLARRLGADSVELDARRTLDGRIVVAHDAVLADGRTIVETPAADLPPAMPTLAEALDACVGMSVNIEIKNLPSDPDFDPTELVASEVVAEVRRRSNHAGVLVSSFHMATVDRVRELDDAIPTAFLAAGTDDVERLAASTRRHGHGALHPWNGMVDAALMAAAKRHRLMVNVWTVDDPARMRDLLLLSVDGIVTNVPDVGRQVVDARRERSQEARG